MLAEFLDRTICRLTPAMIQELNPNYPVDTTMPTASITATQRELREAGVPEIEMTPAMIEAGVETLRASGAVENPLDADRLLVQMIFVAMLGVSQFHAD